MKCSSRTRTVISCSIPQNETLVSATLPVRRYSGQFPAVVEWHPTSSATDERGFSETLCDFREPAGLIKAHVYPRILQAGVFPVAVSHFRNTLIRPEEANMDNARSGAERSGFVVSFPSESRSSRHDGILIVLACLETARSPA